MREEQQELKKENQPESSEPVENKQSTETKLFV
jgi:hypothetical protein